MDKDDYKIGMTGIIKKKLPAQNGIFIPEGTRVRIQAVDSHWGLKLIDDNHNIVLFAFFEDFDPDSYSC